MEQEMINPAELVRQAREEFVAKRAVNEKKFNDWYAALLKCPKETVLDKIPFDYHNLTLQSLVPEWYSENPDPEVAKAQWEEANKKINSVNEIINLLNKEGLEELQKYRNIGKQ